MGLALIGPLPPWPAYVLAQSAGEQVPANPTTEAANILGSFNPLDRPRFIVTIVITAFGLLVLAGQMMMMMMLRRVEKLTADDIARNCAITVVIISSVILIIAGYNTTQAAPTFGLFGTIIGYLLGRSRGQAEKSSATGEKS